MKKIVAGLFCLLSMIQAIEIDVPFVKRQVDANQNDVGSRLLLAKYYLQNGEYALAKRYVHEILKIDPTHTLAHKIKNRVEIITDLEEQSGLKNASIGESLHALYQQKKYATVCEFYEKALSMGLSFDSKTDVEVADAYHKVKKDNQALALLAKYHDRDNKKVQKLKREIALAKIEKRLKKGADKALLKDYIFLLRQENDANKVIKILEKMVQKNPKNIEAKIALAENLYWKGDVKKAFHTLYEVRKHNQHSITLYTNILYAMGDYEHALYYLPQLIQKEKSPKERFILEKKMAFAYMHVGDKEKANKLFKKLLKSHPKDKELRLLQEDYAKKFLLAEAIRFHKAKDMEKALDFYRRYHDKNPDPKIAKEIAEIYYFSKRGKLALPYFQEYLAAYPEDTLIRFHYASVYEKEKAYKKSLSEFGKILAKPSAKEYFLARYHYANSLMHTYDDHDWLEARKTLISLVSQLESRAKPEEKNLLKYSRNLLKSAMEPIKKPMRYKDIILTEGSHKIVNPRDVFAIDKIEYAKKPSSSLDSVKINKKTTTVLGMDYVDDSSETYTNYKIGFDNIVATKEMNIGIELQNYHFKGLYQDDDGMGVFVNTKIQKWNFGVGIDAFDDFNTIVPRLSWNPTFGAHSLFMEAFYRNGAFVNYRNCMVKNETQVYHFGLYDAYLLDDLTTISGGLDINHFEDDNTNLYGELTLPIYENSWLETEHTFFFNENIEYNSNTKVCSLPSDFYDTSYLKYKAKFRFQNGYIQGLLGAGYVFKNQEAVLTYGLNGEYTIENFVTLSLNCERLQSSFTGQEMTFCRLNMLEAW